LDRPGSTPGLFFENMGRSERFRRDNVEMCRRG
jgi:hypothetical protein